MHRHLVSVKIGIEGCTTKWMQTNRLTFDQNWTERLDTKSVKCWRTVQKNVFSVNHLVEHIPNFFISIFDDFFSALHIERIFSFNQFSNHKWFEKRQCHFFRKTTLIHFEFWTNDDHRTTRIIHAFSEQILTETTLFTLENIRK